MTIKFKNGYLEKLFQGLPLNKKPKFSSRVVVKFKKTVLILYHAESLEQLRDFTGLNFEPLKGKLKGYYSVRVDSKYRLVFSLEKRRSTRDSSAIVIEDLSNHYS